MISFNDQKYFAKGTCNVLLEDINTGDILLQSDKVQTSDVLCTADLSEIRAGDGNPTAGFISSNATMTVSFDEADFQLWAKGAQAGSAITFSAPVPVCQILTAQTTVLRVSTVDGIPTAELGRSEAYAYVQKIGQASYIPEDNRAYPILPDGTIEDFVATASERYKVWYFINKPTAKKGVITSLMNPMVVRCILQIAIFSNRGDGSSTKAGWLYYTIPYMKLQANSQTTGNQSNADTTKISGTAIAFRSRKTSLSCMECGGTPLGYMVFVPNKDAGYIKGIAVIGGVVNIKTSQALQIPVVFVMVDGSTQTPADYLTGFTYTVDSGGESKISINESGVVYGLSEGTADVTITYTDSEGTVFTCNATVVVERTVDMNNLVGYAIIGYAIIG